MVNCLRETGTEGGGDVRGIVVIGRYPMGWR